MNNGYEPKSLSELYEDLRNFETELWDAMYDGVEPRTHGDILIDVSKIINLNVDKTDDADLYDVLGGRAYKIGTYRLRKQLG